VGSYCGFINDRGDIAGMFRTATGLEDGFIRKPGGTFREFTVKGTVYMTIGGINALGAVAGNFQKGQNDPRGFLRGK
jgi:hypothetical protein